jgi:peptidoglycan/LPS O-acetylase OafA/YrhL
MFCAVRWNSALARYLHPYAPAIRFAGLVTYPLYLVHWELGRAVLLAIGGRQPLLALAVALATVGVVACSVAALEPRPADAQPLTYLEAYRSIACPSG